MGRHEMRGARKRVKYELCRGARGQEAHERRDELRSESQEEGRSGEAASRLVAACAQGQRLDRGGVEDHEGSSH